MPYSRRVCTLQNYGKNQALFSSYMLIASGKKKVFILHFIFCSNESCKLSHLQLLYVARVSDRAKHPFSGKVNTKRVECRCFGDKLFKTHRYQFRQPDIRCKKRVLIHRRFHITWAIRE